MRGEVRGTVLCAGLLSVLLGGCRGGPLVVVGSKNFTEQNILGELLAQQIERETDLTVDRRLNLGGTFICDHALRSGAIDGYVEYTGTALRAILRRTSVHDSAAALRQLREAYAPLGIEWLEPLGFNNTFAIIVRAEEARRRGIRTVSEAVPYARDWVAAFGYEFIEREDGLQGLTETYGLQFAGSPRIMELGLMYRALAAKQVDVIAGDSTSGLIEALELTILEDDRQYFPPYDAVPVFRSQTLIRYPQLKMAILALADVLDAEDMQQLNHQVDGLKRPLREVVAQFLARTGDGAGRQGERLRTGRYHRAPP